jgi:hypothetical protein
LVNNVGSIGEISVDDRAWGDGLVIVICEIGGSESSGTPARD